MKIEKAVFPQHGIERKSLLARGYIAIRFIAAEHGFPKKDGFGPIPLAVQTLYWHVGFHSLSPFVPVFSECGLDDDKSEDERRGRIWLKAQLGFAFDCIAIKRKMTFTRY